VVAGLRAALDPGDRDIAAFDLAAAHRLYAEILAPVEAGWRGAHTIVAVVSGSLATLPLSVLPTEATMSSTESKQLFAQYRNVAWLARKAALAYAPSVTTFTQLRALPAASTQRSPFAGFGDPMFSKTAVAAIGGARGFRLRSLQIERVDKNVDPAKQSVAWLDYGKLTPLPDTRDELLSIARVLGADATSDVFLGLDANRRRVKEIDLSRRRIVAFATHGLVPGDFPGLDQPALALSVLDDAKESPLLLLEDVLGLKLDADWVVLSACNTAAGDGLGADAISGLGRGFFYAGSRALLATHWPVETVSARLLTTGIFERYAKDPAVTRAQALNASMLALIDSPGSAEYSYAHPLFWAPFALFGDGGR
jgi:CHAT domain-containing protein